ncbi:hypothetical protein shim_17340 [Shimia sp. SK013]|uniref:hypothetical protein n=1 Tax=Shimia sp. SK013 TaxID=1389006 RepID=UPI0006B50D56|nr:hypothetical protein [Shimia sp. SK013]KPA21849.1 hypothetical protein shim_17340 [Shimia sp. SK013]
MTLPEFKIDLTPKSEEATRTMGFKWADDRVGQRSKIGGTPDLPEGATAPPCPSCGKETSFVSQLDSIGDDLAFADVGLLFTFVCFDCFEAVSFIQSS